MRRALITAALRFEITHRPAARPMASPLVVAEAYGLPLPLPTSGRLAGEQLLATETRDLMAPPPELWKLRG